MNKSDEQGQPNNVYTTKDLSLAAFLRTSGVRYLGLVPQEGNSRFMLFQFAEKNRCEELAIEYLNDAPIACQSFLNAREGLRRQVFSGDERR